MRNQIFKFIVHSSKFKVGLLSMLLISVALVERLVFDLGPNVELVTLVTFIAGFYLNKKSAIAIPLLVLAISDIFKANTNIMLFTWSGYLIIGIGAVMINKLSRHSERSEESHPVYLKPVGSFGLHPLDDGKNLFRMTVKRILLATSGGAVSSLWFYLWTNFGVWFLDNWRMYPKTPNGLISCYINGIPFLKNQLFSNLLIIPLVFILIETAIYFLKNKQQKINLLFNS